jgi:tellurite resistance protein TerC
MFRCHIGLTVQVLTLGILGAIVLRAVFIFAGVMLIERFTWLLALFGVFLVYTGGKALKEEVSGHDAPEAAVLADETDAAVPTTSPPDSVVVFDISGQVPSFVSFVSFFIEPGHTDEHRALVGPGFKHMSALSAHLLAHLQ